MAEFAAAGPRPLLRAALAGTVGTVLALFVLLRGLFGLLGPTAGSGVVLVAAGASVVFLAAAFGGAVGAWQAAVAGVSTRRAIVVVGAAGPALVCLVASVVLAVTESVGAGRALLELAAIAGGSGAGAWAFPRVVVAIVSLRGQRGQASVEYVGALILVAAVVAVLAVGLPRIAGPLGDAFDVITGGGDPQAQTQPGAPAGPAAVEDPQADDDGDGLGNAEEATLGTRTDSTDSDGDGVPDGEEYAQGTDPARALEPITEDNLGKPWERVGISEDEWRELEDAVLDEVNPGGVEEFLTGPAADGLTLDENGELTLIPPGAMLYLKGGKLEVAELQENGVGGGLVKGLVKLVGRGGRAFGPALGNALGKLSPALRARLARVGVGPAPKVPPRLPQDLAVSPTAPRALATTRSVGRASHNRALQQDLAGLPRGASDIRVNQQQVNAAGQRVGINRPDLQYTLNGRRYYVEYEGVANPRGAIHQARLAANDPGAAFRLRIVP